MSTFGQHLRDLRLQTGMKQSELAERMNLHMQTVSRWERGISEPDIAALGDLARALGVSLERLFGVPEEGEGLTGCFDVWKLGQTIGRLRNERNETQKDLAQQFGISADAVSRWERGLSAPTMEQLVYLAQHFGISVSGLYFGVGEEQEEDHSAAVHRKRRRFPVLVSVVAAVLCIFCTALVILLIGRRGQPGPVQYTVMLDGEAVSVYENDWYTPPTPEKEGYAFLYWSDENGEKVVFPLKVTQDSTFSAVFTPQEYRIGYWLNGGHFTGAYPETFRVDSGEVELPAPEKEGDTFEGWYLTADYSSDAVSRISCTGADVNLYARWSDPVYTILYELNGGTLYEANPGIVTSDQSTVLRKPVRDGYLFLGWYDQPQGGQRYESVGGTDAANLKLYALWQRTDALYTVMYDSGGGTVEGVNPVSVGAGEVHRLRSAYKPGHEFLGWNTAPDGSGTYVEYLYGIEGPLELYAIYTEKEYLIRYEYEGRYETDAVNPNRVVWGESVPLLSVSLYGYDFVGWYDAPQGGNRIDVIGPSNILTLSVLYARYTPRSFVLTLDASGGSFLIEGEEYGSGSVTAYYGQNTVLPVCTRPGYDFLGWVDENGSAVAQIDPFLIRDRCLTARWRQTGGSYSVSYVLDGGILTEDNPQTVPYGETYTLHEPERAGYVFLGWYDNPQGQGAAYTAAPADRIDDLVLYALWQEHRVNGSIDCFRYEVVANSTVRITAYLGESGKNIQVNIPAEIEGLPVTELSCRFGVDNGEVTGERKYYDAILLPDSLQVIGRRVFAQTIVTQPPMLPDTVREIGDEAFHRFAVAGVNYGEWPSPIPEGVVSIGREAFAYCRSLTGTINLSNVKIICGGAFKNCIQLNGVSFGERSPLVEIGAQAFYGCVSLTGPLTVVGAGERLSVGENAFYGCSGLSSVTLSGYNAIDLEVSCFEGCITLQKASIETNFLSVGDRAFRSCFALAEVDLSLGAQTIFRIGEYAFAGCRMLSTICYGRSSADFLDIQKGVGWNDEMPDFSVYCYDAVIVYTGGTVSEIRQILP